MNRASHLGDLPGSLDTLSRAISCIAVPSAVVTLQGPTTLTSIANKISILIISFQVALQSVFFEDGCSVQSSAGAHTFTDNGHAGVGTLASTSHY
jgi:hypothetical protein